jgi:23S rRNA pseudouridine2605 synthase
MKGLRPGHVPLERALSKLGIASRTQGREWILAGRVRVNGTVRKDPGFGVVPERAVIEIDSLRIERASFRAFALHKPRGVVTTRSDEKGRPTVFSVMNQPDLHLIAVGRLDWATSGLLLLTNDNRLSDWLTDPAHGVQRTYLVTVRGKVTEEELERLRQGVTNEGDLLQADAVVLRKASGRESHLTVCLSEGKNREIRRMFASLRHEVTKLKRISYGSLELGELQPGEHRELGIDELKRAFPDAPLRNL